MRRLVVVALLLPSVAADGAILGFYGEAFGAKSKGRQEADNSGRFVHIPRQVLRQRLVEQLRPAPSAGAAGCEASSTASGASPSR